MRHDVPSTQQPRARGQGWGVLARIVTVGLILTLLVDTSHVTLVST